MLHAAPAPSPFLPGWIHPRARLIDGGRTLDAWNLALLIHTVQARLQRCGRTRATVGGESVATLLAAIAAAERLGLCLHISRTARATPDSVLIRPDGTLEDAPPEDAPPEDASPATAPAQAEGFSLILETSGTTGTPKRVRHSLARLMGRVPLASMPSAVWLLCYDPCGFAGLQVVLTAVRAGAGLVVGPDNDAATLARLALRHAVTHASGTPSFWRTLLLTGTNPDLLGITLGGETVHQDLLDSLSRRFPHARIRHIYASTEAGALFAVSDGREGFPARWLEDGVDGVMLRIRNDVLEVLSPRAGERLDRPVDDAWITTGDLVEVKGERVFFRGRNDNLVNVGGVKVLPEATERRLLSIAGVRDAVVRVRSNPITGALLTAQLVPAIGEEEGALRDRIRTALADLPPAARPRRIELVPRIALMPSGKKCRREQAE